MYEAHTVSKHVKWIRARQIASAVPTSYSESQSEQHQPPYPAPILAFVIVGVFGLWFMAGETRRFHEEQDEIERRHREVMARTDEVLRRLRIHDSSVN